MQLKTAVKKSKGKGRGVFATRAIKRGDIIEIAPVIVLTAYEERKMSPLTSFYNHFYVWGKSQRRTALVGGHACFYNHSHCPNVAYRFRLRRQEMVFYATRNIRRGDELTHDYSGGSEEPVWVRGNTWCMGAQPTKGRWRRAT